jgi:osmotically-inducible protein OsmY
MAVRLRPNPLGCALVAIALTSACASSPPRDATAASVTSVTQTTSAEMPATPATQTTPPIRPVVVHQAPLMADIADGHDRALERRVAAMLTADPAQKYSDVRISATPGGTVTLRGVVTTVRARRNIEEMIAYVPGVAIVLDDLMVDARAKPPENASLVPNVVSQLDWDPRLDGRRVHVEASRYGEVILRGRLASESQRDAAIDDAARAGATEITDLLEVIPGAPPLNPR